MKTPNEFENMDWYRNAWIYSYKGNKLSLSDLKPEDLDVEEIGHALSNTCRFGGHCKQFYSVAEHCYIMSHLVKPDLALSALLHDGAEYILTDVPKPFKALMPEFEKYEKMIMDCIDKRYNVNTSHPDIKVMDKMMVISEANILLKNPEWTRDWPYPEVVRFREDWLACLDPVAAKFAFMERYYELIRGE